MTNARRYCARVFSDAELALIRTLIAEHDPPLNRAALSRVVCERLHWRKPDGGLKDMSARVALLRMHREGVLTLPPARKRPGPRKPIAPSPQTDPPSLFEPTMSLEAVRPLRIEPIASSAEGRLWNAFVARYHYLGHHPLPGAQMRYFVRATNGEPLAVLGFGAAAWKTAPRDEFIGWSPAVRQRNLALVVNNARFLILPWIRIRNLASHLLAQLQRRLPHDWERRYAVRPVLLETFCETSRFLGTCYQSANWLCVGQTQGPRQARRAPPICPAGEERLAKTLAQELENDPLPLGNRRPVRPRDRKLTINQGPRDNRTITRAPPR